MKIISSKIDKITICEIPNMDPISLYLEDNGGGKGKITITCFNDSWSYYWSAMGGVTLAKFLMSCDNDYLFSKLNPHCNKYICDESSMDEYLKEEIIKRRKELWFDADSARELYDKVHNVEEMKINDSSSYQELMYNILGDEWWDCYPTKINPEFQYFSKIMNAIKDALREIEEHMCRKP